MRAYVVNTLHRKSRINPEIYGHFAEHLGRCVYGGLFVGQDSPIPNDAGIRLDVLEALREIRVPVLRWPGGCFADTYHWKDGVGPVGNRKPLLNIFWGGVTEDNTFGTHEYMRLCELLGCEPYINGNLGSGTVQEMADWVQYLTSPASAPLGSLRASNGRERPWQIKYFGVGNESWGCGGNMRAEDYAREYKRYQTYLSSTPENKLYKIACGPAGSDLAWMETLMQKAADFMDGISLHHYALGGPDWKHRGSALRFGHEDWYQVLRRALQMDRILSSHERIMDRYDPAARIGLIVDEWGTWYEVEPDTEPGFLYQQNTMRDAMVAATMLNIFNRHSARVAMANLAQAVNVLQAIVLTDGPRMLVTPTYHVFDLYKEHQGATLLDTFIQSEGVGQGDAVVPDLHESASIDGDGRVTMTIANLSPDTARVVDATLVGCDVAKVSGRVLSGALDAHNTFDEPAAVRPRDFSSLCLTPRGFRAELPPASIVALRAETRAAPASI
jgi:alpha-N-arabinofuranosidase